MEMLRLNASVLGKYAATKLWQALSELRVGESLIVTNEEAQSYYKERLSSSLGRKTKENPHLGRFSCLNIKERGFLIIKVADLYEEED